MNHIITIYNPNNPNVQKHLIERPKPRAQHSRRWLVLLCSCLVAIGNCYSYDIPAALYSRLYDAMISSSNHYSFETYFNLLYTCYSVPNVILPLFGGKIVDQFGALSTILFTTIVLIGQTLFTIGVEQRLWWVMLLGRTVYGLGGENLGVSNSALLARWFVGSELGMAFGISMAIGRLGSVLNNFVSPTVARDLDSTEASCWVGVLFNLLSLVMALVLYKLDRETNQANDEFHRCVKESAHAELTESLLLDQNDNDYYNYDDELSLPDDMKEYEGKASSLSLNWDHRSVVTASTSSSSSSNSHRISDSVQHESQNNGKISIKLSEIWNFGLLFWLLTLSCFVVYGCILPFNNIASALLLERDYFKEPPSDCTLRFENQCTSGYLAPSIGNPSTDEDGFDCPGSNFAPVLPTSLNFTQDQTSWDDSWDQSEYVFDELEPSDVNCEDDFWAEACTKAYCDSKDDAVVTAGRVMSIPYILSALLAPFLGGCSDKYGRRTVLAVTAPFMLAIVHLVLGYTTINPAAPLIGQGVAYAVFASVIWPSVPLVEPRCTGTAYGVMTAIQNIGLACFPIVIAVLHNESGHKYIPNCELFFSILALFGLCVGLLVRAKDKKYGGILNKASEDFGSQPISHSELSNIDSETFEF